MAEQELSRYKAERPDDARVQRVQVLSTRQVSPGFVRVTLGDCPDAPLDFVPRDYDQWFRLFFAAEGQDLRLPWGGAEGWYSRWLGMEERSRPTIRNYTVRGSRRTEDGWAIDVDFVVHQGPDGAVEGVAARWALGARPGDELGLLDQGLLFCPADAVGASRTHLLADETGLPGIEGIAASLPAEVRASVLVEIAHDDDRRALPSAADLTVQWVRREHGAAPGSSVRARVAVLDVAPTDYVYAVGEGSFALAARARAQHCGVPRDRVDFCAYWRPVRRAAKAHSASGRRA